MSEFVYPHEGIRIHKANDAETRDRAIRIYKASPERWEVQLRAPMGIGFLGLRDGKDFCVASAACSSDDMRALRLAIDDALRGCCGENETGSGEHDDECPVASAERRALDMFVELERIGARISVLRGHSCDGAADEKEEERRALRQRLDEALHALGIEVEP